MADMDSILSQILDEAKAKKGSDLYRTRAVVATILKCVTHDLRRIPTTHPIRTQIPELNNMISLLIEAVSKHLRRKPGLF